MWEQFGPRDTQACCRDIKQPASPPTSSVCCVSVQETSSNQPVHQPHQSVVSQYRGHQATSQSTNLISLLCLSTGDIKQPASPPTSSVCCVSVQGTSSNQPVHQPHQSVVSQYRGHQATSQSTILISLLCLSTGDIKQPANPPTSSVCCVSVQGTSSNQPIHQPHQSVVSQYRGHQATSQSTNLISLLCLSAAIALQVVLSTV